MLSAERLPPICLEHPEASNMPNPRLTAAASPYLRQHANDPVAWYQWGPEAFDAARERDVPIFLSSGYSACHWCHVMQRESFRDPVIAALINERFLPVKVDRELRPDVDALYMDYVVATTGNGGWPLSVFLAPDLSPLLGGTYLPPQPLPGLPAFIDVLEGVDEAYRAGGEELAAARSASLEFLRQQASPRYESDVDRNTLDADAEYLVRLSDSVNGGFGDAPKFPQGPLVQFLCAYYGVNPDASLPWVVTQAVTSMIRGGIYDQAGGGLFRYSTDASWRIPHFEKMLYDNALLLSTLAAAAPLADTDSVREEYAFTARQTAAFLQREMALSGGGYAASLSADQGGVEGAAYLWRYSELAAVLDDQGLALAVEHLGAQDDSADATRTLTRGGGRGVDADAVDAVLARLFEARSARPRPEVDGKLVTAWNALAARGLLEAGAAFGDEEMTASGVSVLRVLLDRCVTPTGILRVPGDESVARVRLIEDAAHLASACLTAHEITGSGEWLETASRLHAGVVETFADGNALMMVADTTDLPVRPREQTDEPTPSGAATTIETAVRLASLTGDAGLREFASVALRGFWAIADFAPEHAGRALQAAALLVSSEPDSER
jgi:uncharacterized protein YyaL (SSP411 family)